MPLTALSLKPLAFLQRPNALDNFADIAMSRIPSQKPQQQAF